MFGKLCSFNQHSLRVLGLSIVVAIAATAPTGIVAQDTAKLDQLSEEASEASMAAYADAANFQTGGAIELAVKGWNDFLDQYPDHPMASKAAHYLGVCYMQQEAPDYDKAAEAFAKALKDKTYDLREESLANQGWCLYASGSDGNVDSEKLEQVIQVYASLRKESPKSRFLDRSYFYSGEAAYKLGDPKRAVKFYDDMLSLANSKESSLRCDALYARGVALEEIDQFDQAFASYQQLMDACADNSLAIDVRLRLGDIYILRKEFDKAVESFQNAIDETEASATEDAASDENIAYAIFRQAYALVQDNKPALAAEKYAKLAADYPDSPYAASATLASAQSLYRSGDIDKAAEIFRVVLGQKNVAAATESAHWLARIAIGKGDLKAAVEIATERIDEGVEGEFVTDLKLDLAEALSMDPATVDQSMEQFENAYRESPDDDLAARALYNAAFSGLQVGKTKRSLELANEFLAKFPNDVLVSDVKFVAAESLLATGDAEKAASVYQELLSDSKPSNPGRPVWVLRAAAAMTASRDFDAAVELIDRELPSLTEPNQKAEANLLAGQTHMMNSNPEKAVTAFVAAHNANPGGPRAGEAKLLQGQALVASGDQDQAEKIWKAIIAQSPKSRMADQARFKLAELASAGGDHDQAITLHQQILSSDQDPGLHPYAQYGIGFAQIQKGQYADAAKSLDRMMDQFSNHPLARDSELSRGIARRNLKQYDEAREDLNAYLDRKPTGVNLGHALYELALIDSEQSEAQDAATKLQRIVREVPDYPAMDKVIYELGWAMQDSGKQEEAMKQFESLATKYPETTLASEAAYFVGQQHYRSKDWGKAAEQFAISANKTTDPDVKEKSLYRLGWAHFKNGDFEQAEKAFSEQAQLFPESGLAFDASMMVAESRFKRGDYAKSLEAYAKCRQVIQSNNDTAKSVRNAAERQARELVMLHGGQSAAQLSQWDQALSWYDELRQRFPASDYLPQVFYETGFAYQQKNDREKALKFFGEVANNYRTSLAARARFMMGEIHFAERAFDKAILEFQRVMFGFGADKAPASVKNWQAKSGFEAGRCSELLMQSAKTEASRKKAAKISRDFYAYVIEKHADHELAVQAKTRMEALKP
ncbi:tol-pal system protein YbgF [Rubripirellula obstinata]|uniref:Tol-pal system protein YbgF n=1 Tax=Rubripirellula obstinata TaxID=406547 RepID=A0A5B1CL88_9BACT|nr:tetratricopeptide repeat protein [Rubripirellula obstinata]KAA1260290.1 tol-pal system protein YbgF [Rubripirellula obstinata]